MKPLSKLSNLISIPIQGKENVKEKLSWLQNLRKVVFPMLFVLLLLGVRFHYISSSGLQLYFFGLAVFIFNYLLVEYSKKVIKNPSQKLLFFSLSMDLVSFCLILISSKGIANPFLYYIFIHGFLAGILLDTKNSLLFEGFIHLALFGLQYFSLRSFDFVWFDVTPLILSQHLLCFISWAVSFSLAKHLSSGFKRINNLKLANEKSDRLRALGALSSGFSHEFASPLNTIKIKLKRIEREDRSRIFKQDLRVVTEAVEKCEITLRKMNSSLFRSDEAVAEEISIRNFLDDLVKVWSSEKLSTMVKNSVDEDLVLSLPIFNFTQIVLFILDNSFEACKLECLIEITSKVMNDRVSLYFDDRGEGFSSIVLDRVGEPFNTDKGNGTGLGLFSVDLFMTSVGGSLGILNLDVGARIVLEFPISAVRN